MRRRIILGLFLFVYVSTHESDARKTKHKLGKLSHSRSEVTNEEETHGPKAGNKGPPLDGDNQHEDIRNKGKPPKKMKGSTISKTGRLVNRFDWLLQVNGLNVSSTRDSDISTGEINVTSIGKDLVEIQGVETGSYVCMNSQNGDMYVSKFRTANCIFKEHVEENFHSTFKLNVENSEWYLGIDEKGRFLKKNVLKPDFATLFQLIS